MYKGMFARREMFVKDSKNNWFSVKVWTDIDYINYMLADELLYHYVFKAKYITRVICKTGLETVIYYGNDKKIVYSR